MENLTSYRNLSRHEREGQSRVEWDNNNLHIYKERGRGVGGECEGFHDKT